MPTDEELAREWWASDDHFTRGDVDVVTSLAALLAKARAEGAKEARTLLHDTRILFADVITQESPQLTDKIDAYLGIGKHRKGK